MIGLTLRLNGRIKGEASVALSDWETLFTDNPEGAMYDASVASSCFQDYAGTTPALADDPVALQLDLSGNGNHRVSVNETTARPIRKTDGSAWWLESDGTDDRMLINPTYIGAGALGLGLSRNVSGLFYAAGARLITRTDIVSPLIFVTGGTGSSRFGLQFGVNGLDEDVVSFSGSRLDADALGAANGTTDRLAQDAVFSAWADYATRGGTSYVDNVSEATSATMFASAGSTSDTDAAGIEFFGRTTGPRYGNVRSYAEIILNRAPTSGERGAVQTYLTARVTPPFDGDSFTFTSFNTPDEDDEGNPIPSELVVGSFPDDNVTWSGSAISNRSLYGETIKGFEATETLAAFSFNFNVQPEGTTSITFTAAGASIALAWNPSSGQFENSTEADVTAFRTAILEDVGTPVGVSFSRTVDLTPPDPTLDLQSFDGSTLGWNTNSAGTLYWVISDNATETAATIISGTGDLSGSTATVVNGGTIEINTSTLSDGTWFVHAVVVRTDDSEQSPVDSFEFVIGGLTPTATIMDGDGGMIVLNVPESMGAPDTDPAPVPEYELQGEGVVRSMRKQAHGTAYMRVWVTAAGQNHVGAQNFRWRWSDDGTGSAGTWSAYEAVTVTNTTLPTASVIDLFDGANAGEITVTLADALAWGRFQDGQPWVVAPSGTTATAKTPAPATVDGNYVHGAQLGAQHKNQGMDSRAARYGTSRQYDFSNPATIAAGRCLILSKSSLPNFFNESRFEFQGILTVLAERPPKGTFRPPFYDHGPQDRPMYHVSERKLERLGTYNYGSNMPAESEFDRWHYRFFKHPFFYAGDGNFTSRHSIAWGQSSNYHQHIAQDQCTAAHMAMAAGWSEETRTKAADALIQRIIDTVASNRASQITNNGNSYWYSWPVIAAGILLDDVHLRGHDFYGEWNLGEYDMLNLSGGQSYRLKTWDQMVAIGPPEFRNLSSNAENTYQENIQVWSGVLRERTITYDGPDADVVDWSYYGITDNGDGTYTIPANRFNSGMAWFVGGAGALNGDLGLLYPYPTAAKPKSHPLNGSFGNYNDAWWESGSTQDGWGNGATGNPPSKQGVYIVANGGQSISSGIGLRLSDAVQYSVFGQLRVDYARSRVEIPMGWFKQTGIQVTTSGGHNLNHVNYQGGRTPSGNPDSEVVNKEFVGSPNNAVAKSRFVGPKGITRPRTVPGKMRRALFTWSDNGNGRDIAVAIPNFPSDGWSPITDFEYSIDGGSTLAGSLGISTRKGTAIVALPATGTNYSFSIRAKNAEGSGAWSEPVTASVAAITNVFNVPTTWNKALAGGDDASIIENGTGPSGDPSYDFTVPGFGTRTFRTDGIGGTKDTDTVSVSFYAKRISGGAWMYIQLLQYTQADTPPNLYAWVNLTTGAIDSGNSDYAITRTEQAGGWWRVSFAIPFPFTSAFTVGLGVKQSVTLSNDNTGNFSLSAPIGTVT